VYLKEWTISQYKILSGSGQIGLTITFFVWFVTVWIGQILSLPLIVMPDGMWWVLLVFFAIDFFATLLWSLKHLPPSIQGKELITTGPYAWTRHPFYGAFIWSGTGIVVLLSRSWFVLFSVIPVSLFWVWAIINEEESMLRKFGDDYQKYLEETGQFFPKLKRSENKGQ